MRCGSASPTTTACTAALWGGEAAQAAAILERGLPPLDRSMLTRVHHVRAETQFMIGRTAIANAAAGTARAAVEPWIRKLRRNPVGMAPTMVAMLAGCAALRDRDDAAAALHLRDAVTHADALQLGIYAAAARIRLGEALGDAGGAASGERGVHDLARLGVTEPTRTVALFAPR
jgi:hypothetical protein